MRHAYIVSALGKEPMTYDIGLHRTFVMPIAAILSLYDVRPTPVPHRPASTHPIPSRKIPVGHRHVCINECVSVDIREYKKREKQTNKLIYKYGEYVRV